MFELHELIPYIFTIGLIFTVSYAYIAHLHCGVTEFWMEGGAGGGLEPGLPALSLDGQHRPEALSRIVRRRESPDEDEPDCKSSLNPFSTNQRGGYIWNIRQARGSLLHLARDGSMG
ncbi:hypothetical protein QP794_11910 [Paenibacillus sp. UMB7766-LJ446]|uniref:hypothetical protein n=1 Tax=unclassified Paenibacillus TaxID=185978 RepID=UPI00254D0AA0|nr:MULTISPECIES: hypothetical protein [unclassified Paenibacillus]MDK8190790.1 hypothetical protein [Paenibacillus sp. UMB7766-LJ446]MDN8589358.1 hypothetical protein [Paenibacillus sp. 11B]